MNGDSIFFENHMLSREIEFLVTNIWQCADIADIYVCVRRNR